MLLMYFNALFMPLGVFQYSIHAIDATVLFMPSRTFATVKVKYTYLQSDKFAIDDDCAQSPHGRNIRLCV